MKFLIDTNVFIPLEPTNPSEEESLTESALQMASLAMEAGYPLYRHPAATFDLDRDRNLERSRLRHLRIERYPLLPDPPPMTLDLEAKIGSAPPGSNDWVDHQLLAALAADAVDFLITEDRGIHAKGRRGGIGSREQVNKLYFQVRMHSAMRSGRLTSATLLSGRSREALCSSSTSPSRTVAPSHWES
jgi:hypothetical protein